MNRQTSSEEVSTEPPVGLPAGFRWNSPKTPQLEYLALWVNLGVRSSTMLALRQQDIKVDRERERMTIHIVKDKVRSVENRTVTLKCGYAWRHQKLEMSGICAIHPPNSKKGEIAAYGHIPLPKMALLDLKKQLGNFKDHAVRRAAAIAFRMHAINRGDIAERAFKEVMGWGDGSYEWSRYSANYQQYEDAATP